ncbi:M64 family metallopeptidase [uncultured Alistipes sp.]|uniref:M64 family metallopeptidase n=1 Tax=uncultured Alistipes sp. TaxID=538949 RepID=UPI0032B20C2A
MHHRTIYLIVSILSALISSCSSDKDVIPTPIGAYLTVENGLRPLSASGGEGVLRFSTDEAWHIETAAGENADPWFEIDPMLGGPGEDISVSVRVNENTAYLGRSFTLTIRTASLEKSVEITQLKRNAIIAGENRYELSAEEQTLTVEILSNVEYEVEITEGGEWLAADDSTRSEPGLSTSEHRFTVGANSELQERSATVVFKDLASDLQDEVTVVQAAMADPDPERTALRAIYREANGGGWTNSDNWCTEKPLGEWYGVRTDDEGHVVELRLPQNNLRGAIAHEIANLGHLRILDMSRNELECDLIYMRPEDYDIVCDIDGLHKLEEIDLSRNRLRAPFGGALALEDMPGIRRVDLSYNEFTSDINSIRWRTLFENGRTVELFFNGNKMSGEVNDFLLNHPEWDRIALQIVRQYYPSAVEYGREIHVPEFTFTDMRTGAQQSIRNLCSQNERTMILAWDPTDEKSIRFAERSVRRYHTLYEEQGFAVVAIVPEGEEYRRAAEQYLATHEVEWPVVADYADAQGRRIMLDVEPYPSYLLFDREAVLVDDVFTGAYGNGVESITFDLTEREFQYANYMNEHCGKAFGDCTYESRDYSMDKKSEMLQRATKGKGIDIVLIGDVFTDIDIETGFYRDVMEYAMETFFSVEPTKSYREYFNVYMIYAVSKKRQLSENWNDSALKTVADEFERAGVDLYPWAAEDYVAAAHTNSLYTCSSIIVNAQRVAVTYMGNFKRTYAYTGLPYNGISMFQTSFRHESIGHGFGLLGDEYTTFGSGTIPELEKQALRSVLNDGSYLNLALTKDPIEVPWAHLIGHPNYPEVDIYEGGYCYEKGVWRSAADGIMRASSDGYFNTVCRELLVKRILTLAGEEYTFNKFLQTDIPPTRTTLKDSSEQLVQEYQHCPPRICNTK